MKSSKSQVREPHRIANLSDANLLRREEIRRQNEVNTRQFQKERNAQNDCQLNWEFYYDFTESSLGLPYESRLTLIYMHRSFMQLDARDCSTNDTSVESRMRRRLMQQQQQRRFRSKMRKFSHTISFVGDTTSSEDDMPAEQLDSGSVATLLVSYGDRVQWDLHFKDPLELKKAIVKLNVKVASAFMDPKLDLEGAIAMDTTVASIDTLALSLADDINKLVRKYRMMYQCYDERSHPSRSNRIASALTAVCQFLGISRLSFLSAMLQPNPTYTRQTGIHAKFQPATFKPNRFGLLHTQMESNFSSSAGRRNSQCPTDTDHSELFDKDQSSSSEFRELDKHQVNCPFLKMTESVVTLVRICDKFDDTDSTAFNNVRGNLIRCCFPFARVCLRRWDVGRDSACGKKWMFVADTFLGLMNMRSKVIEEVMLFDTSFVLRWSKRPGVTSFVVSNRHVELTIDCATTLQRRVLLHSIRMQTNVPGRPGYLFSQEALQLHLTSPEAMYEDIGANSQGLAGQTGAKTDEDEDHSVAEDSTDGASANRRDAGRGRKSGGMKSKSIRTKLVMMAFKDNSEEDDDDEDNNEDDYIEDDEEEEEAGSIAGAVSKESIDSELSNIDADKASNVKTTQQPKEPDISAATRLKHLSSVLVPRHALNDRCVDLLTSSDDSTDSGDDNDQNDEFEDKSQGQNKHTRGSLLLADQQQQQPQQQQQQQQQLQQQQLHSKKSQSRRRLNRLKRKMKQRQKREAKRQRRAALAAAAEARNSKPDKSADGVGRARAEDGYGGNYAENNRGNDNDEDSLLAGLNSGRIRVTQRLNQMWRGPAAPSKSHNWHRPFGSFAPSRTGVKAQWYLDGAAYMFAVADAIECAGAEIWICANRLSPEVHLRRPDATGQFQLGSLLAKKAATGVRICLLLDNPSCMAGVNYALQVVDYFEGVPNVHVLLHPADLSAGCFTLAKDCWSVFRAVLFAKKRLYNTCFNGYCGKRSEVDKRPCHCCFQSQRRGTQSRTERMHFSHNEKLVVVDQKVALIAAVDLTWGVWDTSYHVINDVPTAMHTSALDSRIKRLEVHMQDAVETYWAKRQFQCEVLQPEMMHAVPDSAAQQKQNVLHDAATQNAISSAGDVLLRGKTVFLQGHLRDLQRPPDTLGCVSDYDRFAVEPTTRLTKPFSPFRDVNDPTLDSKYMEVTRLLDSRFSGTMRSALAQEAKRVTVPALRPMSRPDAIGRSLTEPAHVDQLFNGANGAASIIVADAAGGSDRGRRGGSLDSPFSLELASSVGSHVRDRKGVSSSNDGGLGPWQSAFDRLHTQQSRQQVRDARIAGDFRGAMDFNFESDTDQQALHPQTKAFNLQSVEDPIEWPRVKLSNETGPAATKSVAADAEACPTASTANRSNMNNSASAEMRAERVGSRSRSSNSAFNHEEASSVRVQSSSREGRTVCVADCMRLKSLSSKPYADLSDDSDSSDPDEAPSDLLLRTKRRLMLERAKIRLMGGTNGLNFIRSTRTDIERKLSSLRRKVRCLKPGGFKSGRHHGEQHQLQQQLPSSLDYQHHPHHLGASSRSILLENVESATASLPKLRRHFAMKEDGSRFTTRLFPGLDYWNPHLMPITQAHASNPYYPPSHLNPTKHPRLPIHSVGLSLFGCGARDAARHFIERWNFARNDVFRNVRKMQNLCISYQDAVDLLRLPLLAPRCYARHDLDDIETRVGRQLYLQPLSEVPFHSTSGIDSFTETNVNFLYMSLGEKDQAAGDIAGSIDSDDSDSKAKFRRLSIKDAASKLAPAEHQLMRKEVKKSEWMVEDEEFFNCMDRLGQGRGLHTCRVSLLRSLGRWSGGVSRYAEENSILLAYYSAIANAQQFVYIENELFISQGRNRPLDVTVKNRISFYLYKRILQARSRGEPFKVYIVIPLFPSHDGQLLSGSRGDYTSRKQMHYLYQTLFRGEDSLTHRLLQRHIAPHEYLSVCCLQKFDRIPDGWLAQEIYVQSNLMIVDDRIAIIGSARVADHSLLGWRNSELAVRVEDVGFVRSLRMALWGEHLDLAHNEREALLWDPGDSAVWNLWCTHARNNSQIMQEVFRSLPNNAAYTMTRLHDFSSISYLRRRAKLYAADRDTAAQGLERLCQIKGQLVVCSGCFMEGSKLLKVPDVDQSWRSWLFWPDFSLV